MRKLFQYVLALVLLVGCGTTTANDAPKVELDNYLYEVSDDAGNKLYIIGTIDYAPSLYSLDGKFKEIYDMCDVVALDMSLNMSEDNKQRYETGYPLNNYLEDEEFEKVWNAFFEKSIYQPKAYEGGSLTYFHQRIVSTIGSFARSVYRYGLDENYGIRKVLSTLAREDGKDIMEVVGFDTICSQYEEVSQQAAMFVVASLMNTEEHMKNMNNLLVAYVDGSVNQEIIDDQTYRLLHMNIDDVLEENLSQGVKNAYEAYKPLKTVAIDDKTFENIVNLIPQNNVLLGFDICDLLDEDGLLKKLENANYKIKKL